MATSPTTFNESSSSTQANPKNQFSPRNNAAASSKLSSPPKPLSPPSPQSTSKRISPSNKSKPERPYALYSNQPTRSSSYTARQSSLRQKSFNLQKMSHSISQNLVTMQYRRPSSAGSLGATTSSIAGGGADGTMSPSIVGSNNFTPQYQDDNYNYTVKSPPPPPLPTLPKSKTQPILDNLNTFLTHHLSFHRPVALVTSGGTITTLEKNTIRYLDNFSTGQRGAISVEEFCKRGYAVIHLWREGSASPYSRVFSKLLGVRQGNHALDFDSLGYLFEGQGGAGAGGDIYINEKQNARRSQMNRKKVYSNGNDSGNSRGYYDPWLSTTKRGKSRNKSSSTSTAPMMTKEESSTTYYNNTNQNYDQKYSSQNRMKLTSHILNSNLLQRKLRERSDVITNNLLFTIPFTTIEEYIALLKLTSEAMDQCQSLGLIYLAAAVSDFYIPEEDKVVHKIQSRDYKITNKSNYDDDMSARGSNIVMNPMDNSLSLTMKPVPKVIRDIREKWAPHSFCVSFKLETDEHILRQKVESAIDKYGVHLVVGNILESRHSQVSLYQQRSSNDEDLKSNSRNMDLECTQVTKSNPNNGDEDDDDLEDNIISHVVEKHFEYIANHYLIDKNNNIREIEDDEDDLESIGGEMNGSVVPRTALMTGAEAAARHNAVMRKKKEMLQKDLYWKHVKDVSLNIAGHALGCYLSFVISSALQNYMQ